MTVDFSDDEVAALVAAVDESLTDPSLWETPKGYPGSLALCVIDSIFSIGVNYSGVVNVVKRYREYRRNQNGSADQDGLLALMGSFEHLGSPDQWASTIGNKQRTSTRSGILKAEAVLRQAHSLGAAGVWDTDQLHGAESEGRLPSLKTEWQKVPGQKSGVSWNYFLMLARVLPDTGHGDAVHDATSGVKPDRMIKRFVAAAIGSSAEVLSDRKAAILVKSVADAKSMDVIALDHAIWRFESGRLQNPED